MISAATSNRTSDVRPFSFENSLIVRRDLTVTSDATSPSSDQRKELSVTVIDSLRQQPLADATVFLLENAETSRTDDAGTALLHPTVSAITVAVRRTGFGERSTAVRLGAERRQRLRISLMPLQLPARVSLPGAVSSTTRIDK
jgi:hypothetical protein